MSDERGYHTETRMEGYHECIRLPETGIVFCAVSQIYDENLHAMAEQVCRALNHYAAAVERGKAKPRANG